MPLPMLAESGGRMPFKVWTLASLIWPRTTASAPALFGDGFAKKAKERDEELKCLNQVTKTSLHPTRATFFRGGHPQRYRPQYSGSGQNYHRGRRGGFQRRRPYQTDWRRPATENKKTVVAKTTSIGYISLDLPIVTSILEQIKYLPTLTQSPIIESLIQTGITPMAQRVSGRQTLIAGRIQLFQDNWKAITNDP